MSIEVKQEDFTLILPDCRIYTRGVFVRSPVEGLPFDRFNMACTAIGKGRVDLTDLDKFAVALEDAVYFCMRKEAITSHEDLTVSSRFKYLVLGSCLKTHDKSKSTS